VHEQKAFARGQRGRLGYKTLLGVTKNQFDLFAVLRRGTTPESHQSARRLRDFQIKP
jgi:hypothetical protein